MSKGTIGSVVGGVIGFVVTGFNPVGFQVGAMIGGAIGASFDTVQGRKVGEMSSPRAQEGEPIPVVFGSARVTGRLMLAGKPEKRTVTDGGKGSPGVKNESWFLSYSILICESSELRNSSISGILMVIENGKIVYDKRPDPAISAADSAKWLQNKVFYFGEESQGVDPTEQMIDGVGNTPAYRGIARMVVHDENLTERGGSIPTYEFVTTQCAAIPDGVPGNSPRWLGTGQASAGSIATSRALSFDAQWLGTGDSNTTGSTTTAVRGMQRYGDYMFSCVDGLANLRIASLSDLGSWSDGPVIPATGVSGGHLAVSGTRLFYWCGTSDLYYIDSPLDTTWTSVAFTGGFTSNAIQYFSGNGTQAIAVNGYGQIWSSGNNGDSFTLRTGLFYPDRFYTNFQAIDFNGNRFVIGGKDDNSGGAYFTDNAGVSVTKCLFTSGAPSENPGQIKYCGNGKWLMSIISSGADDGLYLSIDNAVSFNPVDLPVALYCGIQYQQAIAIDSNSGRVVIAGRDTVTDAFKFYYTDNLGSWTAIDISPTDSSGISELYPFGSTPFYAGTGIPDAPGNYIDPITGATTGPVTGFHVECVITLQQIVDRLDERAGIPIANRDSDDLAGIVVPGYAVDTFMTVAEAKEPLRRIWFFTCTEWDDAIRYRLLGKPTDFTVDPEDIIPGDDGFEKGQRGQTVEYPKRLHVQYVDPATGYKPMKQTAERISPDIRVKGEVVAGANITISADTAKRAADIGMSSAWAEREDSREIILPIDYWSRAIAGFSYSLSGRRYRITDMRLEAGAIYITSVYDRASAYVSNAVGNSGPTPSGPPSGIYGPTIAVLINVPVLRDENDKPGIVWAARGYPGTAWPGARLQVQRGADWVTLGDIEAPCNIGELLTALPTGPKHSIDYASVMSVRLPDDMSTITFHELLNEKNALAVMNANGTAEILQAQDLIESPANTYTGTTLIRGCVDTTPAVHAVGSKVVALNERLRFAQLLSSDLGKTLTFRAFTLGTDPDAAPTMTLTLTTMESQREWQPYNVTATKDADCQWLVEFIGRARLGTDAAPIQSQWFKGWRIDFKVGAVTHSRLTQDQSFLYTTALQVEDWGAKRCDPYNVTVTAVNEYTGGDGSGGTGTGTPPSEYPGGEVFAVSGTFPNGYVGIPYIIQSGDAGLVIAGGYWDGNAYGFVTDCVGTFGLAALSQSFRAYGIALDVATAPMDVTIDATSPNIPENGSATVTQNVTFAAFPTFSPIDVRFRPSYGNTLVATTPPWSTFDVTGPSPIHSFGFTSGKCYGEFQITGNSSPFWIGVNAAKGELTGVDSTITLGLGIVNTAQASIPSAGTYYVKLDAGTGAWEVGAVGGAAIGSGTLALPSGNQYRLVCTTDYVQTARVRGNFGIETFAGTVPVGYGGVPMPTQVIPAQWSRCFPSGAASFRGDSGGCVIGDLKYGNALHHTFARPGKASGKWRVHIAANGVVGLAVSTYSWTQGALGTAGTANSVGYQSTGSLAGHYTGTLNWCFGGVTGTKAITMPLFLEFVQPIWAYDGTANTIQLYAKLTSGDVVVLHTLTGVPAGTWYPTEYASSRQFTITSIGLIGPAGYADWTQTFP